MHSIPGNKISRNQKNIRMTGFRKSAFLKLLNGWKKRAFHQGDIWLEFKEVETQMMLLLPERLDVDSHISYICTRYKNKIALWNFFCILKKLHYGKPHYGKPR